MDYSLFVVKLKFDQNSIAWFENFKNSTDYDNYSKYIYKSTESAYLYYIFCIIDYFQVYDSMKQFETKYKLIGNNYSDIPPISCVPPDMYSFRFIRFLSNNFKWVLFYSLKKNFAYYILIVINNRFLCFNII